MMAEMPLDTGDAYFYDRVFRELLTDRPFNAMAGYGAIPLGSIRREAEYYGFGGQEAEYFLDAIRTLEHQHRRLDDHNSNSGTS